MEFSGKNCILFDDNSWQSLLPLTFTRPVAEIRLGILTIREKWEIWTGQKFYWLTQDYLKTKFPFHEGREYLLVNGSVTPNRDLIAEITGLESGEMLMGGSVVIAAYISEVDVEHELHSLQERLVEKQLRTGFVRISRPWHIFQFNGQELNTDFDLVTRNRKSISVSSTNTVLRSGNLFVERDSLLEHVTLNCSAGPIYIGKNTEVMEGSMIRGPVAVCEGSVVKMGTRIYGPTTIGPYTKVGGEITNSVLFAFSNKVHDGYLGNSVIGEWCNIGAGTNASNLKNSFGDIKIWSYVDHKFEETGLQFCGLIMGDHSKCGINTMFNTGTVVGICTNIYGAGFPRSYVPSFSKGGAAGFKTNHLNEVLQSIERSMVQRHQQLAESDAKILKHVYDHMDRYPAIV